MVNTSRRTLMTALAAAAAAPMAGLTSSPARAATAGRAGSAVSAAPAASAFVGTGTSVTLTGNDAAAYAHVSLGPLTATALPGSPARTEIRHGGARVAVLTTGARTVLLAGPERTFRENKKAFADVFARTTAGGWGNAPAGGSWSNVNGPDTDYEVAPGNGVITLSSTTSLSRHVSLRDDEIADVDVRSEAHFSTEPAGAALSYSLSFGYQDTKNHYRARLSFSPQGSVELRLEKEEQDIVTLLSPAVTLTSSGAATSSWTIRVRREGSRLQARAWRSDAGEPATWTAQATDTTFGKGRVGIRAVAPAGTTNLPVRLLVTRFAVDAATWAAPPTVTHRDWVRVLPAPFDGNWTAALEERIRGWAGSTAPDVFAHAAMFLADAPHVTSAALGAPVLGEAGYGPLIADGTRREGADFHEYMGLPWTFPDGTVTPAPSAQWHNNLDCSGYVRMVYGHHMGVPLGAGADTTGTVLPRRSRDIAAHAPGVRIAHDDAQPPAVSGIQPGDLVLFDADTGDGTDVDHVGIHLGTDQNGDRRFLSSRKTSNGPTMADLGGPSLLEGTGLYARTLRTVHRI